MTSLSPFLPHLLTTLEHRPYVFAFLITFLIFGILQLGLLRTLFFLFSGWIIAFASEVSSIRNGFPYGDYQYIYENLKGELILWGVPLWDSLSYTFLAYASYATSVVIGWGSGVGGCGLNHSNSQLITANPELFLKIRTSFKVLFLSILLMTGIDIIIDPLTHMGDRWFLGKIYYYPNGGFYFNVPISNFLGWALVAFTIIFLFQKFDSFLHRRGKIIPIQNWQGLRGWLGVALYLGVYLFNWSITIYLKEWNLVIADLILLSPLLVALVRKGRRLWIRF